MTEKSKIDTDLFVEKLDMNNEENVKIFYQLQDPNCAEDLIILNPKLVLAQIKGSHDTIFCFNITNIENIRYLISN